MSDEAARKAETIRLWGHTLGPDGSLQVVSPSQRKTFDLCPLKWYNGKVLHMPGKPASGGAKLGGECHERTETFLKTGSDVRGSIELIGADQLKPYLWAAPFKGGPGIVEGPLTGPILMTPGGVKISGFIDYEIPGSHATEGPGYHRPIIIDHKFRGDVEQWAETEEELGVDPQAVLYTVHALEREPAAQEVEFMHLNVQTKSPRFPKKVSHVFTREEAQDQWVKQASIIDQQMAKVAKLPVAEVPHAGSAGCRAFGGCDYAATCPHAPMNRLAAGLRGDGPPVINLSSSRFSKPSQYERINPMGLVSQINAAASPPAAPVAPTPAPAAVSTQTVAQAVRGHVYMLSGDRMARFEGAVGSRFIFRLQDGVSLVTPAGTESAEDLTGTIAEELFTGQGGKPAAPAVTEAKRRPQIVDVPSTPAPAPVQTAPAAPVASIVPPGEGKPTDPAALAPAATGVVVTVTTAEAIATPAPESATAAPAEGAKRGRKPKADADVTKADKLLMLLVNCSAPNATDLSGYVKGLADGIAARESLPDVRLAPKTSDCSYGGWKGMIAIEALKAPPVGVCSIISGELSDPVIEALSGIAPMVVRPTR